MPRNAGVVYVGGGEVTGWDNKRWRGAGGDVIEDAEVGFVVGEPRAA